MSSASYHISEKDHITRAAEIVSGATLVSRITGYLRDMVVAYFFGSGMAADAFFVAFRIPNLLRRLFAEGALSIAFIPVFTEHLKKRSHHDAMVLAQIVFTALSLTLLAVTALGIAFTPTIVRVMAPGFLDNPEKYRLTVELTRIAFPYILFIGLGAVCMGVLNSLNHFLAPAIAPILLNIFMIASVYVWGLFHGNPIYGLAAGVLLGGAAQLILQLPFMKVRGFSFNPCFSFSNPAMKRILLLMGPAALGAAVYQLNIVVGTLLASLLPSGSVSYLYYADRLVEFPLGVFAISLGTAVLPSMSRHAADNDMTGLVDTFSHTMRLVLFEALPSSVGLIILRQPLVELLYQRGAFNELAARMTAQALLCYTLGLWAFSSIRILVSVFYSLQDTKTPVKIASISILANIGFSLALMGSMKHNGLALATSLSAALNVLLLTIILKRRLGHLDGKRIFFSFGKTLTASLAMAIAVSVLMGVTIPGGRLVNIAAQVIVGLLVFLAASWALGNQELAFLKSTVLRKKKATLP